MYTSKFSFFIFILFIFSIKTLEGNHDATAKDLIEAKTDFRKTERHWMAEKEFLMRKVQFLQHYGSVVPPSIDGGGYFTENRSNLRRGGDLKVHRDLQKLNVSTYSITEFCLISTVCSIWIDWILKYRHPPPNTFFVAAKKPCHNSMT